MGKYSGSKCLICGETFKDADDVVVCPDCGTPYHRSCYLEQGSCINTSLHENGGFWEPEMEKRAESAASGEGEPIRCARCGQENPPEGLFCNRCGLPLTGESLNQQRSFNDNAAQNYGDPGHGFGQPNMSAFGQGAVRFDQDSDIDGVKLGDLARYVGKNQFSFLTHFIRFGKFGGKASLNFCALLFPQYWFFYRKMPLIGAIYLVLTVALSIPTVMVMSAAGYLPEISFVTDTFLKSNNFNLALNLTSSVLMVMQCISAIFANYWYYKQARRQINEIRSGDGSGISDDDGEELVKERITRKGGTSFPAFLLSVLVSNALVVFTVFVMNKL